MTTEQQETSFDSSVAAAREALEVLRFEVDQAEIISARRTLRNFITQAANDKRELEDQRDFLVEEYERAVGCGPQGYLHCAGHLFNAICNAKADAKLELYTSLASQYEELRKVVDGGSETYTHEDAVWQAKENQRIADAVRNAKRTTSINAGNIGRITLWWDRSGEEVAVVPVSVLEGE